MIISMLVLYKELGMVLQNKYIIKFLHMWKVSMHEP
jgi:hypothetical protein